ncbi:MAG TPA: hypothetical protein VFF73_40370 [Planctomycetota bacterium]|nr:hypothetical protein [Planctomycetota bacterium]
MNAEMLRRVALRGGLVALACAGAFPVVFWKDHAPGYAMYGAGIAGIFAGVGLGACSLVELVFEESPRSLRRAATAASAVLSVGFGCAFLAMFQVAYAAAAMERGPYEALGFLDDLLRAIRDDPGFWCGLALACAAPIATGAFIRLAWGEQDRARLAKAIVQSALNMPASMVLAAPGLARMPRDLTSSVVVPCCLALAVISCVMVEMADALSARLSRRNVE